MIKRSVWTVMLAILVVTGCARRKAPTVDPNAIFGTLDALVQAGETNKAIETAARTLDDPVYAQQRVDLFGRYLRLLAVSGRGEEAAQVYVSRLPDSNLARAGYDLMLDVWARSGDTNAVETWTRRLAGEPLPPELQEHNLLVLADVLLRGQAFARLPDLASLCMTRLEPAAARRVLQQVIAPLMGASRFQEAGQLIDAVAAQDSARPEFIGLVALTRLELLIRQGQWAQAETHFLAAADSLTDTDLAKAMAMAGVEGRRRQQLDFVDKLCAFVLNGHDDRPAARREAASQWVDAGKERGGGPEAVRRMTALLDKGMDPQFLLSLYARRFYTLVNEDKWSVAGDLIVLGDKLAPRLTQQADGEQMTNMLFEACFMAGDYRRALAIMRGGMPDRDAAWLAMAENKLRAHLALQEGRTDEAVERFRKFMAYVSSSWNEGERDPLTGMPYTREMTMGLNAKRIGDILAGAKKQAEAANAYKEARAYFDTALSVAVTNSPQSDWVKKQLAALPADAAQP